MRSSISVVRAVLPPRGLSPVPPIAGRLALAVVCTLMVPLGWQTLSGADEGGGGVERHLLPEPLECSLEVATTPPQSLQALHGHRSC